MRLLVLLLLVVTGLPTRAATVDVGCFWEQARSPIEVPGLEALNGSDPVVLRIDPETARADFTDPDQPLAQIFPNTMLSVSDFDLQIVPGPNRDGSNSPGRRLLIKINRFTLRSTIQLELLDPFTGKFRQTWARSGQCALRQL